MNSTFSSQDEWDTHRHTSSQPEFRFSICIVHLSLHQHFSFRSAVSDVESVCASADECLRWDVVNRITIFFLFLKIVFLMWNLIEPNRTQIRHRKTKDEKGKKGRTWRQHKRRRRKNKNECQRISEKFFYLLFLIIKFFISCAIATQCRCVCLLLPFAIHCAPCTTICLDLWNECPTVVDAEQRKW